MWNYRPTQAAVKASADLFSLSNLENNEIVAPYISTFKQFSELSQMTSNSLTELTQQTAKVLNYPNIEDKKQEEKPKKRDEKVKLSSPFVGGASPKEMMSVLGKTSEKVAFNPNILVRETGKLAKSLTQVVTQKGEITPDKGDRRFSDTAWIKSPMHQMAMQGYLAWSKSIESLIDHAGLDDKDTQRMHYISSLVTDAMSPSNSLLGNPVALKEAEETGGKSLVEGFHNLINDMTNNNGLPSQVDKSAFKVGGNLAATSGMVVFKNEVFELIQYSPKTAEVQARPIMFIPPVVNKYYLLDLAPGKSCVEYLINNGFQVYMVSWRNPTRAHRDWGLDEYVKALIEGIEAILAITHSDDINLYAACTGAIPMTALLGYLAAKGKKYVKSATMVVAVLDSNEDQSLGLFASEEAIAKAKMKSNHAGVLDGAEIGRVFTWMRPNDLVWNYWVNNYLMGKKPPAFDILYWNNDSTRVTAKLHAHMLDVFSKDLLGKPGGLTILGEDIDTKKIDCDVYMVGGATDHISMWKGVFNSTKFFGGKSEFILHSSGHVQSIVTPPGNPKSKFHHNSNPAETAQDWFDGATEEKGSWWDHWSVWLSARSGEKKAAPETFGNDEHLPIIAAPGVYVLEQ
jgi:polyhydroxyalkanoate synthase subunit PhaC